MPHLRRLGACRAQKLLNHPVEPLGLLDLDLDEFVLGVAGPIVVPQISAVPRIEPRRVLDFVGQHRRHLPQRGEPLCPPQLFLDSHDPFRLGLQLVVGLFQALGGPLEFQAPGAFALCQEPRDASDHVIHDDFQVFLHLQGQLAAPLEEDMGRVDYAYYQGADQSPAKAEPEGRQDDRQVVKTLEDVVQIVEVQGCQIVE